MSVRLSPPPPNQALDDISAMVMSHTVGRGRESNPLNSGFADRRLPTWLPRRFWKPNPLRDAAQIKCFLAASCSALRCLLRFAPSSRAWHASHLTNRWSQPLAAVKSTFDFMKQFPMFAALAAASGGSAPSR